MTDLLPPASAPHRPTQRPQGMPRTIRRAAMALALAGVAGFGAIVYSALRADPVPAGGDVPLITADNAPVRERPEQEGGMEIANRDSTVYDTLSGSMPAGTLERLMPMPEDPVDGPDALAGLPEPRRMDGAPALSEQEIKQLNEQRHQQLAATPPESLGAEVQASTSAVPAGESETPQTVASIPVPPVVGAPEIKPEVKPEVKAAAKPVSKPVAESKAVSAIKPAAGPGARLVQLGAVRTEAAARAEWTRLQAKHRSQLGGLEPSIEQADLGARGIYWRIRGGTVSAEQAQRICAELAKAKQNCMVVGK